MRTTTFVTGHPLWVRPSGTTNGFSPMSLDKAVDEFRHAALLLNADGP